MGGDYTGDGGSVPQILFGGSKRKRPPIIAPFSKIFALIGIAVAVVPLSTYFISFPRRIIGICILG